MTEYEQFIMRYQGRNNERKRKGIPMRRKIVHNKGAYKHWIGAKLDIMMQEIMSRVISTRPYPYHVSVYEKLDIGEKIERASKSALETMRDARTYRLPLKEYYGCNAEVYLFDESAFIDRAEETK